MKRLFVFTFIAGLLVVAVAATVWPMPKHLRYRSLISVAPDGGRQEDFVIRWPEDRIPRPGEFKAEPRAPAAAVGAAALEDTTGSRVSAEMFRLRDTEDNVIGVASRLAGVGAAIADPGLSASSWLIVIPSRGAMFLSQTDAFDTTIRDQLTADGNMAFAPAQAAGFWTDRSRIRVTASAPGTIRSSTTGRVLRGTSEFAGLTGSFTETWELDEVSADGSTRGRVVLSTLTEAGD
jgi:hypothetical protein